MLCRGFGLGVACALFASQAQAEFTLESETSAGSGNFSQELTVAGEIPELGMGKAAPSRHPENASWNWKLGYTSSTSPPAPAANGPSVKASSSQFIGGFGYRANWSADLNLIYASTPSEELTSFGSTLNLGYTFRFGSESGAPQSKTTARKISQKSVEQNEEDEDEVFVPSLELALALGTTGFDQSFSSASVATKRGKPHSLTTSEKIRQNLVKPELTGTPVPWFTLSAAYTRYTYNRDVNEFLNYLNQPRSIRIGVGGFADTLDGFADHSGELTATLHLGENWDFESSVTLTRSKSTDSLTHGWSTRLESRSLDPVVFSLGAERDTSPDQPAENLGIVKVSYGWE